ncbi:hypothetical protein C8J56DRAFT_1066092 [Mycena floridula]|nr:hypothetical protein C8J56DRAFT_1066092 [Mycena floridula]
MAHGIQVTNNSVSCGICQQLFNTRGIKRHEAACLASAQNKDAVAAYLLAQDTQRQRQEEKASNTVNSSRLSAAQNPQPGLDLAHESLDNRSSPREKGFIQGSSPSPEPPERDPQEPTPRLDDIQVEYHPLSGQGTKVYALEDFDTEESPEPVLNPEPWHPFCTHLDFEFAELALLRWYDRFTIENESELESLWDLAATKRENFHDSVVKVEYNEEIRTYDFIHRNLWDWAMGLVKEPRLAHAFRWDAQRLYKYDGTRLIHFVNEPWSAKKFWDVQSALPEGGKPLMFIFYADKDQLSTFGTAKGYPVVARLANLPGDIRNGVGIGGGQVVGWLPVLAEEAMERGKTKWVNLKSIIWHKSMDHLFAKLVEYSTTGNTVRCSDDLSRWLFPMVGIISADTEEMFVVNLTRGTNSLHPYFKCLALNTELSDLDITFTPRTAGETLRILNQVNSLALKGDQEDLLKAHGMRPIMNSFARIANTDPHAASSYDELHADDSGLWGKHLANEVPRWRNLNHFEAITTLSFNDGNKHRDVSKIFLYLAVDVLTLQADPRAYQLLKVLRAYMNMRAYIAFSKHSEITIEKGQKEVENFSHLIEAYEIDTEGTEFQKSWNFPKFHLRWHVFDDIEEKGTMRHLSTRPSEKLHGPIRKIYQNQTNFKDVAHQILKIEHKLSVALMMREELSALGNQARHRLKLLLSEHDDDDHPLPIPDDLETFERVIISSKDKKMSLDSLCALHNHAPAFRRLHIQLGTFFTSSFQAHRIPLPHQRAVQFTKQELVVPFKFVTVSYQCTVSWKLVDDYLRCNPDFHHHPRYDFVLVDSPDSPFFGELISMFSCTVGEKRYHVALIWLFEVVPQNNRSRMDKDLGFLRVRQHAGVESEIISLDSVIRGAVAISTNVDGPTIDRLVLDVLDKDMFLRVKQTWPGYTNSLSTGDVF